MEGPGNKCLFTKQQPSFNSLAFSISLTEGRDKMLKKETEKKEERGEWGVRRESGGG